MTVAYLADVAPIDITSDQVLDRAQASDLVQAVVLGVRDDGTMYFESSIADGAECVWLLEKAKHLIMSLAME